MTDEESSSEPRVSFAQDDFVVGGKPFEKWKILVADDAPEVHLVTQLALESFHFEGRKLEILEAKSAEEARTILAENPDIAVAILDVVMETHNAGLDLVRYIRESLGNSLIRLIIRTGQAGDFPASEVIASYEINDYWEKTEVTVRKLQASLTTSLRGYRDLMLLNKRSVQLRQWAVGFADLLGVRNWSVLIRLVLFRMRELFPEVVLSSFLCRNDGARWPLAGGTGRFPADGSSDILPFLKETEVDVLLEAWEKKSFAEAKVAQALYFETPVGQAFLFFLECPDFWGDYERNVSRLVLQNFRAVLENSSLILALENQKVELDASLHEKEGLLSEIYHRTTRSLRLVSSLLEMEQREGYKGAQQIRDVQRRLQAVCLVFEMLFYHKNLSRLEFQDYLRQLLEFERRNLEEVGSRVVLEYWGSAVSVPLEQAVLLGLLVLEFLNLAYDALKRSSGGGNLQIRLVDSPRKIVVKVPHVELNREWGTATNVPLSVQLIREVSSHVRGVFRVEVALNAARSVDSELILEF